MVLDMVSKKPYTPYMTLIWYLRLVYGGQPGGVMQTSTSPPPQENAALCNLIKAGCEVTLYHCPMLVQLLSDISDISDKKLIIYSYFKCLILPPFISKVLR